MTAVGSRSVPRLAVVAAAAAAPLLALAVWDPHGPRSLVACPVRAVVGIDCPGCGSLRALHDLSHGQLAAAADHNALLLLALPLLALVLGRWVVGRAPPALLTRRWVPVLALAIVATWTVARNLPIPALGVLGSTA